MDKFAFQIGDPVRISVSGEAGKVSGRAEYNTGVVSYLVLYKAADGRAVESWWEQSALEIAA